MSKGVDIIRGKGTHPVAGLLRFEPAQDPFRLDGQAQYRLFRQQEEIPDDEEPPPAEDTKSRPQRPPKRNYRWVIEDRNKRRGGLVLHGKEAAKEDAHYMLLILNAETKVFEMVPMEQDLKFQRAVESFTKKEEVESLLKPGKGRKKDAALLKMEEDESRLSKKQRILNFAESFIKEREQEEVRAGVRPGSLASAVDKTWEGKVGGQKYWKAKAEALEKEVAGGLEQEDGTRELLGLDADDPDDYVPDDDDEGHLMEEQALHQQGPGWIEAEDSSDEEEEDEEVTLDEGQEGAGAANDEDVSEVAVKAEEPSRTESKAAEKRKSAGGRVSPALPPEAPRLPGQPQSPRSRILEIFGGLGLEVEYAVMRRELQEQLRADKEATSRTLKELANLVQDGLGQKMWKLKAEYIR